MESRTIKIPPAEFLDGGIARDIKSGARSIGFPMKFPDGSKGAIVIIRIKDEDWLPPQHIKSITIEYADPTDKQ